MRASKNLAALPVARFLCANQIPVADFADVAIFSAWSPIRSRFVSMSRYSIPFRAEHFLFFKRST